MFVSDHSKRIVSELKTSESLSQANVSAKSKECPMPDALPSSSAFKTLLVNFLATGGDSLKLDKKYKKPMRCAVRDVSPKLLLTDGQFLLSAYLTKEALSQYMANK